MTPNFQNLQYVVMQSTWTDGDFATAAFLAPGDAVRYMAFQVDVMGNQRLYMLARGERVEFEGPITYDNFKAWRDNGPRY